MCLSVAREGLKKTSSKSSRVPIFNISTLLEAAREVSHLSNGNRQRTGTCERGHQQRRLWLSVAHCLRGSFFRYTPQRWTLIPSSANIADFAASTLSACSGDVA